jgi:hypothetical protein
VATMALAIGVAAWPGVRWVRAADHGTARPACDVPDRPERPPVRLHLVDHVGIGDEARAILKVDALRPWRAVGVAVEWGDALPAVAPRPGHENDVYVILVPDDAALATRPQPMASIRFVGGRPTTHVMVHAGYVARRLADLRLDDRRLADLPPLMRHRALGRVLGRAVAHEVGHFLLGSATHTRTGLMRASHRIEHLLGGADGRFAVVLPAMPTCLVAQAAPR